MVGSDTSKARYDEVVTISLDLFLDGRCGEDEPRNPDPLLQPLT